MDRRPQTWKACWGQPLEGSNFSSSALSDQPGCGWSPCAKEGQLAAEARGLDAYPSSPLLERLVANLLDNAERYNVAGGAVTVSTATRDATSALRVVNTGAVVPAELVEHLFLPFTRFEERTRHDGFGLGLALVTSIAGIHNGTVHATAVPAGGLDITVRIPRRDKSVTPTPPST